ncbi:DUF6602 domain-containing protein [Chryseobacterium gleum]|uniref:DUF6602 domain-containing protein n=1 Tax=Chryseobacterium gleum TaxID=250 RepID=UPI0028AE7255|nr:DUF6602 domain-containing protein [Chryseobacterium gleum]
MPNQNILKFQKSITKELIATHERVRDLIGDANWGDEGRYKEAILRKIISQFLPSNLKIGTGFIVGNNDHVNGNDSKISKQLDIIIYEDKTPVVFRESDFVILTENSVRAVIEVKAEVVNKSTNSNGLNQIIEKLELLNNFQTFSNQEQRKKFVGVFSYKYDQNYNHETFTEILKNSNGIVNHLALGCDKFIKFWEDPSGLIPPLESNEPCFIKYNLQDLSFSYFISNLLHIISDDDPVERYWFSFPIPQTKEIYREDSIIYLE